MLHLTFEDFLEALIRMSCMKSLPFDAEIEEVGVALRAKGEGGGESGGEDEGAARQAREITELATAGIG